MKIRIKSFAGELPEYLTVGKIYDAEPHGNGGWLVDDFGDEQFAVFNGSSHLNGGSWEIVDNNTTDNVADIKYHVSQNTVVIE